MCQSSNFTLKTHKINKYYFQYIIGPVVSGLSLCEIIDISYLILFLTGPLS